MRPTRLKRFRIRGYETDPGGRLQAPILCKLLQEAATAVLLPEGATDEVLHCPWLPARQWYLKTIVGQS